MAKIRLSSDIEEMRGKVEKRVYTRARNGATLRSLGTRKAATSPAQAEAQLHFRQASAAFRALTVAQLTAWANYGATVKKRDEITGDVFTLTSNMAFMGLSSKFLQISPAGTVPVTPPAVAFAGDSIKVTVAVGSGKLTFTASAGNATDVKTELLLQKLASKARRSYEDKYKTTQFVAFATGSPSLIMNVTPGVYAVAYRFVNSKTGQETDILPLGTFDAS